MTNLQLDQASKQATYNKGYANSEEVRIGFIEGARWHASLPLAERLTEAEKEKIKQFYKESQGDKKSYNELQSYAGEVCEYILFQIFGKTLFTPTEQ